MPVQRSLVARNNSRGGDAKNGRCIACREPDEKDDLVRCDSCHEWFHLVCAGVGPEVSEEFWLCQGCEPSLASKAKKRLRKRVKLHPSNRYEHSHKDGADGDDIDGKTSDAETSSDEEEEEPGAEAVISEDDLDRELELVRRERELLELKRVSRLAKSKSSKSGAIKRTSTPAKSSGSSPKEGGRRKSLFQPKSSSTMHEKKGVSSHDVTNREIAARLTVSKDLPNFSGKPTEWPIFYSCYTRTTTLCGIPNDENLMRLQKALTGLARKSVEAMLTLPDRVPDIIEALQGYFGRAEYIIEDQINAIKKSPAPKTEELSSIVMFSASVNNLVATLQQAELEDHLRNPILLREIVDKLPPQLKLDWANHQRTLRQAGVVEFSVWLHELSMNICSVSRLAIGSDPKPYPRKRDLVGLHVDASATDEPDSQQKCSLCNGSQHRSLAQCKKFSQLKVKQRIDVIMKTRLCRVCLSRHRPYCDATKFKCGIDGCQQGHHQMLHRPTTQPAYSSSQQTTPLMTSSGTSNTAFTKNPAPASSQTSSTLSTSKNLVSTAPSLASGNGSSNSIQMSHQAASRHLLCRYVPVRVSGPNGSVNTFAFLDNGSTVTMVEDWLLEQLGISGTRKALHLNWTGGTSRTEESSLQVELDVAGCYAGAPSHKLKARSVRKLGLPPQTLNMQKLMQECHYMHGLPIQAYDRAEPALLIGVDNWRVAIPRKIREGDVNLPIAAKCLLGWTVEGPWSDGPGGEDSSGCHVHLCDCATRNDEKLHEMLRKYFFSQELAFSDSRPFSMDDRRDQETLARTVRLVGDRYESGLLWKYKQFTLPNNHGTALKRLICLERQLKKNESSARQVSEQVSALVTKGYARKLSTEELAEKVSRVWYLPIFPVTNPNKPGKLRMVFDAAARTNGLSLNDFLSKGPDLMASLYEILIAFRLHKVGIVGDVQEMFMQVKVQKEDQGVQRFLWRDLDDRRPPDTYVLQVMTFGASCSPAVAQHVKNINAERFATTHRRARDAIVLKTYGDDTLDGAENESSALQLAKDITSIYKQGGFNVRNWRSNSQQVQQALSPEAKGTSVSMDVDNEIQKVLGMFWNTSTDAFTYSLKYNKGDPSVLKGERRATKREMLRILMSIYDPLGLLSLFTIILKILVQSLWRSGSNWDDEVNDEQQASFQDWLSHLPQIEKLKIPRCYLGDCLDWNEAEVQLHTFVDASAEAQAAATYLRISFGRQIHCILVGAKTKVAPVKLQSIPRMELNAARLGAENAVVLRRALALQFSSVVFWSDSETVLRWLRTDARANPPYVAFRVAAIQDCSDVANWRYVPTKLNVADEATKVKDRYVIRDDSRWFRGPEFLYESEADWPADRATCQHEEVAVHLEEDLADISWLVDSEKFSSWDKINTMLAGAIRFARIIKSRTCQQPPPSGPLTAEELKRAETLLYQHAQKKAFPDDLAVLRKGEVLPKGSRVASLNPYIDDCGVMRSCSRLIYSNNISENMKRPIILPNDDYITRLLIKHYHDVLNHILHETAKNRIRQKFYIFRLGSEYKKICRACYVCRFNKAKPEPPQMAPIPECKLGLTGNFTHVGVDYFGPMEVVVGRKAVKIYGCLFVDLVTTAVHLETADSLTTSSFIMAYRRFISRRGTPRVMYSDRGTNFIGAEKELRRTLNAIDHKQIATKFISSQLEWKFNPPASPHMGGAWERLVRTAKTALYASLPKTRLLTGEVLRTFLAEVEFTLNSRPLTHLPADEQGDPLTPNHFLLWDADGVKPLGPLDLDGEVLVNNWRRSQQLADVFWRRLVSEVWPTKLLRPKWHKQVQPLAVGDIVLIVDDSLPRNQWLKGPIIAVSTAPDGQVRSATVQTSVGIRQRPSTKLARWDLAPNKLLTVEPRGRVLIKTSTNSNDVISGSSGSVDRRQGETVGQRNME